MKILFVSHLFAPSVGGIETVGRLLVREFIRAGHEVVVVTTTSAAAGEGEMKGVRIFRNPDNREQLQLMTWCDICFHNHISLRAAWPLLVRRRPWVVTTHTWLARPDGRIAWQDRLKQRIIQRSVRVAISRAVQAHLPEPTVVVPNPYDDGLFWRRDIPKTKDLIFVGRLVSDKGADLLVESLVILRARGKTPRLTIVGDGEEKLPMQKFVEYHRLTSQVEFVGIKQGEELARLYNEHRIAVIPSRWNEPFGLVALEAAACGCAVIGSDGGGLPEAIGPCGATFPDGDTAALAERLDEMLSLGDGLESFQVPAADHLVRHQPSRVAQLYLKLFENVLLEGK